MIAPTAFGVVTCGDLSRRNQSGQFLAILFQPTPGARLTAGIRVGTREGGTGVGTAAASQPAEEVDTLDELRFHWGSAYYVALIDGIWTAWRKDGRGGKLADPLAEGLWLRIRAGYAAMPVPRDLP